jgi:hypothetical protein
MKCDAFSTVNWNTARLLEMSWQPNLNDWYETAKLNYGFDFTDSRNSDASIPMRGTRTPRA